MHRPTGLWGLLARGEVDERVVRDLWGQPEAALDQSDQLPVFEAALSDR